MFNQTEGLIELAKAVTLSSGQPIITPLPDPLLPVEPFNYGLLPDPFHTHVKDITERMQCPPDYVAVAFMTVLASVIGRSHQVKPKQYDDWTVVPNLWGLIVGKPSMLKTPAVNEAMKHLKRAEADSREEYEKELKEFSINIGFKEAKSSVNQSKIKALIKKGDEEGAKEILAEAASDELDIPICKRYCVNDATVEKLGELLKENPNGLLQFRDEVSGFLKGLDSDLKPNDRAFYLESFNGTGSYTYDRIGRGTIFIDYVVVSLLGTIQPSKYGQYVSQAINAGKGDDGLAQRFQLAVYPDEPKKWEQIDRRPDNESKNEVYEQIERLIHLSNSIPIDKPEILHFDSEGQSIFNEWQEELETKKLRSEDPHPALISHLAKYRSLMPSIALIIHLAEGDSGSISKTAVTKAGAWCEYLESHAKRIYSIATNPSLNVARLILGKIKKGDLTSGFTLRIIQRKCWAGLTANNEIKSGLEVLADHGYLIPREEMTGGRSSIIYLINMQFLDGLEKNPVKEGKK